MSGRSVLTEGKTKLVVLGDQPGTVLLIAKDDITAGDGAKHEVIPRKGVYATATTEACFRLLASHGLPTHYLGPINERTFAARMVHMIPLEVVMRRRAAGYYLKRHPAVESGTLFKELQLEYYLKDGPMHDPLALVDSHTRTLRLYRADRPLDDGFIGEQVLDLSPLIDLTPEIELRLQLLSIGAFQVLEEAWARRGVTLVDLKIECGFDAETGELLIADVVDNDSWRIWVGGREAEMLDKQVFRNLEAGLTGPALEAALRQIAHMYMRVAQETACFN